MTDDAKLAVAARYLAATRAGDTDAVAELSEPDVVVWHNYDDLEIDGAATAKALRWLHRTVTDLAWEDVSLVATAEGFLWRAAITGSAPGGPLRAHTCVVVTLSAAGKVARVDEYLDPAALAPLTGPAAG